MLVSTIESPKSSMKPGADLIVDVHTTTSNVGTLLIHAAGDVFTQRLAAFLVHESKKGGGALGGKGFSVPKVRLCEWLPGTSSSAGEFGTDFPFLPTLGRSGFTWEIGAVANGVVDSALLQGNCRLIERAFRFVDAHNATCAREEAEPELEVEVEVEVFTKVGAISFPPRRGQLGKDDGGDGSGDGGRQDNARDRPGFVHPSLQGGDFARPLRDGDALFLMRDGSTVGAAAIVLLRL